MLAMALMAAMFGQLTAAKPLDWKAGDRAWIIGALEYKEIVGVPLAVDEESYALWGQLVEARDLDGFERLETAGKVRWIKTGMELLVVSVHPDYLPPALECRTGSGPLDGRKVWIAEAFVGRGKGRR